MITQGRHKQSSSVGDKSNGRDTQAICVRLLLMLMCILLLNRAWHVVSTCLVVCVRVRALCSLSLQSSYNQSMMSQCHQMMTPSSTKWFFRLKKKSGLAGSGSFH